MIEDYFDKVFGSFEDEFPELNGEENYSYYHKVEDRFDNDEHTHTEKEVKNGKVLKDIKKTYKLGKKKEEEPKQIASDKEEDAEKAADEKSAEIEKLNAEIAKLNDVNKKLEEKIKKIEDLIK
jgi:hypothetical protein